MPQFVQRSTYGRESAMFSSSVLWLRQLCIMYGEERAYISMTRVNHDGIYDDAVFFGQSEH